jgi:hypothetical protein
VVDSVMLRNFPSAIAPAVARAAEASLSGAIS